MRPFPASTSQRVTRVARALTYGEKGYQAALAKMHPEKSDPETPTRSPRKQAGHA